MEVTNEGHGVAECRPWMAMARGYLMVTWSGGEIMMSFVMVKDG